jgi:hypothetical protein
MIPKKVVVDIYVLGARVLNQIVSNFNRTLIVTQESHLTKIHTIVKEGLLHVQDLCTTSPRGYVFRLGGGQGHTILLF